MKLIKGFMETIEKRAEAVEQALSDVLAIIDGKEMKGSIIMAVLHGYSVPEDISIRNGEIIKRAYELLGRERPKQINVITCPATFDKKGICTCSPIKCTGSYNMDGSRIPVRKSLPYQGIGRRK